MRIDFNKDNGILNVSLEGRLDTTTAPELESFIGANYDGGSIVVDCEKLVYISSAGLRVLLGAHKKTKGAMKLINVCELVMEVLQMTGFSEFLVIE